MDSRRINPQEKQLLLAEGSSQRGSGIQDTWVAKTQSDWEMDELGTWKGTNYTCNECHEQKKKLRNKRQEKKHESPRN